MYKKKTERFQKILLNIKKSSLKSNHERMPRWKHTWKSALDNFAEKYVIEGYPNILPSDFFLQINNQMINFLKNHKNVKIRIMMICLMGQMIKINKKITETTDKAYFQSGTYINIEGSNKENLSNMISEILNNILNYQRNG